MKPVDPRLSYLRAHPNLSALYEILPFHPRQIVESLLESGVTFLLMEKAGQCMHAEFQEYPLLQILAHGDPRQLEAVSAEALDEIEHLLATLQIEDDSSPSV